MLTETASSDIDFVGHIGGDYFILIFQSEDWGDRCQQLLSEIGLVMPKFYAAEDREIGGFYSEDRRGNQIFYPLSSLSIGVVKIVAEQFASHHEVSAGMTDAKKQAKRMPGNSLFMNVDCLAQQWRDNAHSTCSLTLSFSWALCRLSAAITAGVVGALPKPMAILRSHCK